MTTLIGCGGHGSDIKAIWYRWNKATLRVFDDDPNKGLPAPPDDLDDDIILGSNYPAIRRQMARRFRHLRGARPLTDPAAVIGPEVHLEHGCVIAPNVSILRSCVLGLHTHMNYGASMTRSCLGAFCTVSPGAVICGDVIIGNDTLIGAGAVVCDRVRIGSNVTVAAGAIIPPESYVPDGAKVIGVFKA